jgi:hypothetical protein
MIHRRTGVDATAAGTLPALAGSASGTETVQATAAGTLPALLGAAAATQMIQAVAAGTLPRLLGVADGTQTILASGAGILPAMTGNILAGSVRTVSAEAAGVLPAMVGHGFGVAGALTTVVLVDGPLMLDFVALPPATIDWLTDVSPRVLIFLTPQGAQDMIGPFPIKQGEVFPWRFQIRNPATGAAEVFAGSPVVAWTVRKAPSLTTCR